MDCRTRAPKTSLEGRGSGVFAFANRLSGWRRKRRSVVVLALLMVFGGACTGGQPFGDDIGGPEQEEDRELSSIFQGINSIAEVSDSSAVIHWTHVSPAVAYQIFNTTSETPVYVGIVLAPANSYTLTALSPSTTYKYRVKAQGLGGRLDGNIKDVAFSTLSTPTPPSSLSLISPLTSPGFDNTPTVRVSGVKSGDVVKLFTDSGCTQQVGSATATGTTMDLTTSTLTPGSYAFYASSGNTQQSPCSSASVNYVLTSCPIGFVAVPGDVTLSTTEFCVMQYEAKAWKDVNANAAIDNGEVDADGCGEGACTTGNWAAIPTYRPVSQADGLPWRQIDQYQARAACNALNDGGSSHYALISNPEWMTIARNIENQNSNWSGGAVGNGRLWQGNNNADTVSSYNGSDPEAGSGRNSKARHVLSNGESIWDLSGNLWEWVDWSVTPSQKAYYSADGGPVASWREFTLLNTLIGPTNEMATKNWQPTNGSYDSSKGIGKYFAGYNTSGGSATRGGGWLSNTNAGLFTLILDQSLTLTLDSLAFRCVYHH